VGWPASPQPPVLWDNGTFSLAWFIYRIQTQTGINPLDLRRDGKRSRGEKLEMIEGGKKKPFMIAGKINTSLSCYNIFILSILSMTHKTYAF